MRQRKENLYLLMTTPFRESDLIVNFLSKEFGKLSARVYGGKKIGKSSSFPFHPGDLIAVEYQAKENDEFVKIINTGGVRLLPLESFPYDRFLFHSYLLELIGRIVRYGEPSETIYELVTENSQLEWKAPGKLKFILQSVWKIIDQGGFGIDFHNCSICERESWRPNELGEPVFRKEHYRLHDNMGTLLCSGCSEQKDRAALFNSAMIKLLWILEQTPDFHKSSLIIPEEIQISLIKNLNQHLLKSFEIQPNSLPLFLSSLSRY